MSQERMMVIVEKGKVIDGELLESIRRRYWSAITVEEDPAIEASADEEFTPGDEISEDYPIPLPSDI